MCFSFKIVLAAMSFHFPSISAVSGCTRISVGESVHMKMCTVKCDNEKYTLHVSPSVKAYERTVLKVQWGNVEISIVWTTSLIDKTLERNIKLSYIEILAFCNNKFTVLSKIRAFVSKKISKLEMLHLIKSRLSLHFDFSTIASFYM